MIFNIKSNIKRTYHGLDKRYLKNYLDEFCFRFKPWNLETPDFDKLVKYCTTEFYAVLN